MILFDDVTQDQYRFCYKTIIEALQSLHTSDLGASLKSLGDTM